MNKEARIEWVKCLKQGDTVYYRHMHRDQNLLVEKVGNKYIHLQGDKKIEIATGIHRTASGSGTAGMIYPSKEVYDQAAKFASDWHDLTRDIRNIGQRPAHLTEDDLATIRKLLFPQA